MGVERLRRSDPLAPPPPPQQREESDWSAVRRGRNPTGQLSADVVVMDFAHDHYIWLRVHIWSLPVPMTVYYQDFRNRFYDSISIQQNSFRVNGSESCTPESALSPFDPIVITDFRRNDFAKPQFIRSQPYVLSHRFCVPISTQQSSSTEMVLKVTLSR